MNNGKGHQHVHQNTLSSQLQMPGKGCAVQMLLANFLDNPPLASDIMRVTGHTEMMATGC